MPVNTRASVAPFLNVLWEAVLRLPESVPLASIEDPIYLSFHKRAAHSNEHAFTAFERAYTQCFKPDPQGPALVNHVLRGSNGMDLVISYSDSIAKPSIMSLDESKSTALLIQELLGLVHQRIQEAPKLVRVHSGGRKHTTIRPRQDTVAKQAPPRNERFGLNDPDYTPGDPIEPESSDEELDMDAEKELGILGFGKPGGQGRPADLGMTTVRSDIEPPSSAHSTDTKDLHGDLGHPGPKPGRSPEKGNWAMTISMSSRILPNIRLPSHQTLQRHLYHLFDVLGEKVTINLKEIQRHAIATDAWTSKNSVYSLAGVTLFYINNDWRLSELVLDLVNLDAEHSGEFMGRLIYQALKHRETAHRAIACVTDNASANFVMNNALANRIQERKKVHIHGQSITFTCVNHAFHLICTAILSHLGVVEPEDHFSEVKGSDLPEDNWELEEEGELDEVAKPGYDFSSESDSDLEDLLDELEGREGGGAFDEGPSTRSTGRNTRPLTVPEKIHEILVYATASPKRRKDMQLIISQTCPRPKGTKQLFFKKSMRVRWGSVLAEIKRAVELRPAITFFVASLGSNRPKGMTRERALKLQERWEIRSEEWELSELLIDVLKPFQTATEAMSQRDVATIADVIPTFNILERKLIETAAKLRSVPKPTGRENASAQALLTGLEPGLGKAQQYQDLAHESDLCLISTVLNPRLRLKYLERWPDVHRRAEILFTHIFEDYHADTSDPTILSARHAMVSNSSTNPTNTWESEIYSNVPSFAESFDRELQDFLSGSYPCSPGMSTLGWWKLYGFHFPTISHMARNFLCIPAASVSVERLFSQCKLTMTDICSSMSPETARRRICCQHWMKAGVDADVVREALGIE